MTKEKKPFIRLFILMCACFAALLYAACSDDGESNNGNTDKEPAQPAAARFFDNLNLAAPLKAYSHGNPVMTQNFGADPYAIVYDDRVYLYMTGDTLRYGANNTILQNNYDNITTIRIVSSSDLVNWTEHPAVRAAGQGGAASWAQRSWAPAFAYKEINGQTKFFLYFANGAGGIGVLAADSPIGPFNDPLGRALISSTTPNTNGVTWLFDPAVLVDDDGTGYIYFGGGTPGGGDAATFDSRHPMPGTIRAARLGTDMISLAADPVVLPAPFSFEDSGINKIGDAYYYSYCTNPQVAHYAQRPDDFPEAARIGKSMSIAYMTSDNPLEGFVLGNMIFPNPGEVFSDIRGGNNHHCLFEFRGRWYMAYHTRMLAQALGLDEEGLESANGEGYRITSIDAVTLSGGTINEINGTREGPVRAGTLNPYRWTDAATIAVMAGINTREAGGRMNVTGIHSGDWIAVKGLNFGGAGAAKFNCRVIPPESGAGVIQIRRGGLEGEGVQRVGYVEIEAAEARGVVEITVDLLKTLTGTHDITFVFYGEGYEFVQWQFIS